MRALALDGSFWRRLARLGTRGPAWFARVAPPVIGVAICVLSPASRRAIVANLRRVRGRQGALRDARETAQTFANYALCLAEVLGGEAAGRGPAAAVVVGGHHVDNAIEDGRGVVFATAHTAGWETVGAALKHERRLKILIGEAAERDEASRAIQDEARRAQGLLITHIGQDPFAGLALMKHLRERGVVALQIDRIPPKVRGRDVTLFGVRSRIPEGVLRLASLTGAPILPIFTARVGHRQYKVVAYPPIRLTRGATAADLDSGAQRLADALQDFARAHPTQWFHFRDQ